MANKNEIIRDAANDIFITVDRSVATPLDADGEVTWPDSESYTTAMRVANAEANAMWDEELDAHERKIACVLAVSFWMLRVAANMAGDSELDVFFGETPA
jgi:hypothetical protein